LQQTREIPGNFQGQRLRSRLIIRSRVESAPKLDTISRIVAEFDKDLPVIDVRTLHWHIATRRGPVGFYANALGVFAMIAVVLAAIGIYGLMSYSVTDRIHELAIRASLGATRGSIVWLVVSRGLRLTGIGVIAGIGAALPTRLLESILFGVEPWDARCLPSPSCCWYSWPPLLRRFPRSGSAAAIWEPPCAVE
jgi:putative ABC transport system permease protein